VPPEDGDPYDERGWWVRGHGSGSIVPGGSPALALSQALMSSA
jgi:hypothetical protein